MIPVPTDSISTIQIDMDQNGTFDFSITCSTWYQFISASGPCANYNSSMIVSGITPDNEIAIGNSYNASRYINYGEEISEQGTWLNSSLLQLHVATAPFQTDFNGEKYIGIRIKTSEGFRYGWILFEKTSYVLYVKSTGIQTCASKAIQAGEY